MLSSCGGRFDGIFCPFSDCWPKLSELGLVAYSLRKSFIYKLSICEWSSSYMWATIGCAARGARLEDDGFQRNSHSTLTCRSIFISTALLFSEKKTCRPFIWIGIIVNLLNGQKPSGLSTSGGLRVDQFNDEFSFLVFLTYNAWSCKNKFVHWVQSPSVERYNKRWIRWWAWNCYNKTGKSQKNLIK